MSEPAAYRVLDRPWLYRLVVSVLAPGFDRAMRAKITSLAARAQGARRLLDVGCGPASMLWPAGLRPVGLDASHSYITEYHRWSAPAIEGSATALPFPDAVFDGVWSIGLLHHLDDEPARRAILEMSRVTRAGGYLVLLDAVLPEPAWRRPLAYGLRRLDRGRHVRRQAHFVSLLPADSAWTVERFDCTVTGLELVGCYRGLHGCA